MKIDKAKVFTIIYAMAIIGLISGLFMVLYNLMHAVAGSTAFHIMDIVSFLVLILLIGIILINFIKNDEYFNYEIIIAGIIVVFLFIMNLIAEGTMMNISYLVAFYEIMASCTMLLISKIFLKKYVENKDNNK